MATNEDYVRGKIVPLTVGASVPARNPVCVGEITGVALSATGASGTTVARVLRKGVVKVEVQGLTDAVKLTFATVLNGQTVIFNGVTFTAHTDTTDEATHQFSIAGTDAQDVTEFAKCVNDATHGVDGVTCIEGTGGVCYLVSDAAITAITGTAHTANTVVDDTTENWTSDVVEGDVLYWSGTNASPVISKQVSGKRFGVALEPVRDHKITLASVADGETIIFTFADGGTVTFEGHTATVRAERKFIISGTDTADAEALAGLINDSVYGIRGMVATADTGVITLAYDGDIAITGTAVDNSHLTVEAGTRSIKVKLGW